MQHIRLCYFNSFIIIESKNYFFNLFNCWIICRIYSVSSCNFRNNNITYCYCEIQNILFSIQIFFIIVEFNHTSWNHDTIVTCSNFTFIAFIIFIFSYFECNFCTRCFSVKQTCCTIIFYQCCSSIFCYAIETSRIHWCCCCFIYTCECKFNFRECFNFCTFSNAPCCFNCRFCTFTCQLECIFRSSWSSNFTWIWQCIRNNFFSRITYNIQVFSIIHCKFVQVTTNTISFYSPFFCQSNFSFCIFTNCINAEITYSRTWTSFSFKQHAIVNQYAITTIERCIFSIIILYAFSINVR